jgi:hypothetical protein
MNIDRLLERLQTGWRPSPDGMPPGIEQRDLVCLGFLGRDRLIGYWKRDGYYHCEFMLDGRWYYVTKEIIWIDAERQWMLAADGVFWWLLDGPKGS